MKKKFAIISALLIFCIGLAACTSQDKSTDTSNVSNNITEDTSKGTSNDTSSNVSKEDEKDTVVCYSFGVMSGGPAWGQYQKGFYDACEELGWEGHYLCPTVDNDMTQLFNLHETAISNGADVMIPCVTDNEAMSDILQKAVEQGITMVGASGLPDPHIPVLVGTDNINLGRKIAEALVQCMGDKEIHVVTMQTILAHTGQTSQVDAFEERLHELRPDAEIVRREECNSSAQTSQDKLSAICLANPQVNSFVSFDCYAGLGAASYVESEGLQGKFCVVGIDASAENFKAMKDGYMNATVAQMWYEMGYEAVKLANDLRNGKDVPASNDSGAEIIMPEDIDKWAEKLEIDI